MLIGLKIFAIKKAIKIAIGLGRKFTNDGKLTKGEVKEVLQKEVIELLEVLPNAITDRAVAKETVRREKEGE